LCAAAGEEPGPWQAWERRPGGPRDPGHSCAGVTQLRSGRRDQDQTKDRPPNLHFIVSVPRGPEVSRVRSITELCGLRISVKLYLPPKGPMQRKRCQRFGHTQRNCGYAPRCVACGGSQLSCGCSTRGNSLSAVAVG